MKLRTSKQQSSYYGKTRVKMETKQFSTSLENLFFNIERLNEILYDSNAIELIDVPTYMQTRLSDA